MLVKEYLETLNDNDQVTFIIEFKAKVGNSSISETLFRETPIRYVWEWLKSDIVNYVVTCDKVRPLATIWQSTYDRGDFHCVKITNEYDYIYGTIYKEPKNQVTYGEK